MRKTLPVTSGCKVKLLACFLFCFYLRRYQTLDTFPTKKNEVSTLGITFYLINGNKKVKALV